MYARLLITLALLAAGAGAQPPSEPKPRWLVELADRSFDLEGFRAAVTSGAPADRVADLVRDLESRARADQGELAAWIVARGGRVHAQWWLVNGLSAEMSVETATALRLQPRVRTVEPDAVVAPAGARKIKEATNGKNHCADALQALSIHGQGVTIAIVDSGQDEKLGTLARPHATYFVNGDTGNSSGGGLGGSRLLANFQIGQVTADDVTGHGTAVMGVAAGEKWNQHASSDRGHAPRAGILGYGIAEDLQANTLFSTLITAWQKVAADRVAYKIVAANNSYLGAPSPTHLSQQALDACALHADVLITVAAANFGASTASSQSCANGLAVGAVHTDTHVVAEFSSRGPLQSDTARFYPDLCANGVNLVCPLRDTEAAGTNYVASGTSFGAPQVCGAAALYRAVRATANALETKAALLATTDDLTGQNLVWPLNTRNAYGLGYLRDDRLIALAQGGGLLANSNLTSTTTTRTFVLPVQAGRWYAAVVTWPRQVLASSAWSNLDLFARVGTQTLAAATSPRNLYEKVVFAAPAAGSVTLEVQGLGLETADVPIALAAIEVPPPFQMGSLTSYGQGCRGTGWPYSIQLSAPTGYLTKFGNSWTEEPLGSLDCRVQVVFDQQAVPFALSAAGVALRHDEVAFAPSKTYAFELEIEMGLSPNPPGSLAPTLANNVVPGSLQQVLAKRRIDIVPQNGTNGAPDNWPIRLVYDQLFVYLQQPGRHLLWQATHTNNQPAGGDAYTFFADAVFDGSAQPLLGSVLAMPANSTTGAVRRGLGPVLAWIQLGSQGAAPLLGGAEYPHIGTSFRLLLDQARQLSAGSLLLGTSRTSFGTVTLPFDLTVLGAPGCALLASPEILVPLQSDARGTTAIGLTLPNDPGLVGSSVFGQAFLLDPAANPLGLAWSNGMQVKVGGTR